MMQKLTVALIKNLKPEIYEVADNTRSLTDSV